MWIVHDYDERVEITQEGELSLIAQDDGFNEEPMDVECVYSPNGVPFSYQQINYDGRWYWVLHNGMQTSVSGYITINFDNT